MREVQFHSRLVSLLSLRKRLSPAKLSADNRAARLGYSPDRVTSILNGSGGLFLFLALAAVSSVAVGAEEVDFAAQQHANPWYPDKDYPRLTTPQWVGDEGVDCVVTLGIDDMRDPAKYEQYLRPILNRLKQIDGRAPVSIMTCSVKPDEAQLQSWLAEGLSFEVHTVDHPCPLLNGGDFDKALSTYHRCIDLLAGIPGNNPVAFRTPCCDSLNTVGPRFYEEIFPLWTGKGHHLQIDSSVFNFFTADDETIPRELLLDENGVERFRKYVPRKNNYRGLTHDRFVNYIENYPYPYLINNLCWQFPCVAPSDWSAQHLHGTNNPITVEDWKAALDISVHKKGVFNLVFHPHGWIKSEQVVEFIDHAVETHGRKVLFLTFREAAERLRRSLAPDVGQWDEIRMVDVDGDGNLDVIDGGIGVAEFNTAGEESLRKPAMRLWRNGAWEERGFPVRLTNLINHFPGRVYPARSFLRHPGTGNLMVLDANPTAPPGEYSERRQPTLWTYTGGVWQSQPFGPSGELDELKIPWNRDELIWRDLDGDGEAELILFHNQLNAEAGEDGDNVAEVWKYDTRQKMWRAVPWHFPVSPADISLESLRFVDVDEDNRLDLIAADENVAGVWLQSDESSGWRENILPADRNLLRLVTRPMTKDVSFEAAGSMTWNGHNGFFVRDRHLCWVNENTNELPDFTYRVSFDHLLAEHRRREARNSQPPIAVGAAAIDITPDYPVRLTGYGNRKSESEGVAVRIHARALAIGGSLSEETASTDNTSRPNLLLTVDNCGVPDDVTSAVFARLQKKYGLQREQFVVCSTHTHSGPWLRGFAPNVLLDLPPEHAGHLSDYESGLIEKLVEVAAVAIKNRRPGRLSVARGAAGFAINRRVLQDGSWKGFGETSDGPVDHQLPILAAHDTDGKVIAVLANYACHATTETGSFNHISGDWPGFAADMIEESLRAGGHSDAVALIAIGCGADANPTPRGTHEQAKLHGTEVADEVLRLLSRTEKESRGATTGFMPLDHDLACRFTQIDLPLGPLPTREELENQAAGNNHAGALAVKLLRLLNEGKSIPDHVPDYPVQTWCFGDDLAMVFLGGEVVVDYAIRLNEMFDPKRLWTNAYSNDVPCYIASKRILREGGYEADSSMVYYGHATRLAPTAEDLICDAVQKLLPHSFYTKELQGEYPAPKSAEETIASISTRSDLKVELVAAEPLIADPVAFDWDAEGRLWVVEMRDYPFPAKDGATGRVRVLHDTDDDGQYDQATTFLEGLTHPSGICLWRDGVIITAAPDIIFAADSNGDGKADVRKVLYTGFREGNQQHRVNGLRWGLDGWLYLANGDSGGSIRMVDCLTSPAANQKEKVVDIRGRDVRIQPDFGGVETLSGQTQFCRSRDDFGNWFGNNNSNPIWHYLYEDRYLQRNKHLAVPSARQQIAAVPGAAPVYPTSRTLARFNDFDKSNRFTSACSTMIYRDDWLGEGFYGNAFVCEPVHNLISRLVVEPDGASFRARRAADETQSEFFASSDNWCRPVMVRTGPDGALYVADMYRQVIEHPEWIPPEQQRKLNLFAGNDRGRIYRITRSDGCCGSGDVAGQEKQGELVGNLDSAERRRTWARRGWLSDGDGNGEDAPTAETLVKRLSSTNGWWRDTAQRMLLHRSGDALDRELLAEIAAVCTDNAIPAIQVQALWTLAGIVPAFGDDKFTQRVLLDALRDKSAVVRRAAVRLSERVESFDTSFPSELNRLVADPAAAVRLQLAVSLGEFRGGASGRCLGELLSRVGDDEAIRLAALTSVNEDNVTEVLAAFGTPGSVEQMQVLAHLVDLAMDLGKKELVMAKLETLIAAVCNELRQESKRRDADAWVFAVSVLRPLQSSSNGQPLMGIPNVPHQAVAVTARDALGLVSDSRAELPLRIAALEFLALTGTVDSSAAEGLVSLIGLESPSELQQVIVRTLALRNEDTFPPMIFSRWPRLTPAVRSVALNELVTRPTYIHGIFAALESGQILPADLGAAVREQLINHKSEAVALRAQELLTAPASDREKVVREYLERIESLSASAIRGRDVFSRRCTVCHRLDDIGNSIGADLSALKDRSIPAILTAVLNPNKAVEAKFLSYTALTTSGRSHSGMLVSESGSSITLLGTDGRRTTVPRGELEELHCSNRSLMPDGLEKDLSEQELADVISYVQASGAVWKQFEGNQPVTCMPDEDGSILLPAAAAEIYGPTLVYEEKYANLGFWHSGKDYAAWSLDVPRSGHWTVMLEYACDNGTAGNGIRFSTGTRLLTGRVPGTGSWDNYRRWTVGKLDLRKGRQSLTVTAPTEPSAYLIDLKAIHLIPPE